MAAQMQGPTPLNFFNTVGAHQRTQAIKAAIELGVFTAIAEGAETAHALSEKCETSERGMRILCDYLVIMQFLNKEGERYQLTQDSAVFLNRHSPAYLGGAIDFLLSPMLMQAYEHLTEAVRKGGTAMENKEGTLAPEHPVWVKFARAMAPLMAMPAEQIAELVDKDANQPLKILDIAAGHGMFGVAFARRNTQAEIYGVDWANVLEVAKENAERAGVSGRYHTIPGSAFEVDFGTGYDVVLITNFMHHFDPETNVKFLEKVRAALKDAGRAMTFEFVPNEDRVTPPEAAGFSLTMLCSTPAGDAYTFREFDEMFTRAGFARSEFHVLPQSIGQVIISYK